MPGPKTNEREGTRAVLRHARVAPYKVREVLDLIRGKPVHEADDILRFSERDAAIMIGKVLALGGRQRRAQRRARTPRSCSCRPASPTRAPPSSAGAPGPGAGPPGSASGPATSP